MEYDNQQKALIEDKLKKLQQAVTFLYQDYDYHHQNNELEILEQQLHRLLKANEDLKSTRDAYDELLFKLEVARQKRSEILELLQQYKAGETKEDNKENNQNINEN